MARTHSPTLRSAELPRLRKGRPSFSVHLGGSYTTVHAADTKLVAGMWVHLAGVLTKDKKLKIFVDGKLAATGKAGAVLGDRNGSAFQLYDRCLEQPDWGAVASGSCGTRPAKSPMPSLLASKNALMCSS